MEKCNNFLLFSREVCDSSAPSGRKPSDFDFLKELSILFYENDVHGTNWLPDSPKKVDTAQVSFTIVISLLVKKVLFSGFEMDRAIL